VREMGESELPTGAGAWESRAFFAALLAACRGDDAKAAEILRQIADKMTAEYTGKAARTGVAKRG